MKGKKKKSDIERNKIGGWDNETKDTEKLLRILEAMAKKSREAHCPPPTMDIRIHEIHRYPNSKPEPRVKCLG